MELGVSHPVLGINSGLAVCKPTNSCTTSLAHGLAFYVLRAIALSFSLVNY